LWLCHSRFGVDPNNLFLITYQKGSFGHSLVKLASDNGPFTRTAYCDPWMGIACYEDQYPALADAKLHTWADQGKSLPGHIQNVWKNDLWYAPNCDRFLGFTKGGPVNTIKATEVVDFLR